MRNMDNVHYCSDVYNMENIKTLYLMCQYTCQASECQNKKASSSSFTSDQKDPSLAPASSSAASLSSIPLLASHTQRQGEAEVEEKGDTKDWKLWACPGEREGEGVDDG